MNDRFIFIENLGKTNEQVNYSREDIVNRINEIVNDLIPSDEDYKSHLITDITDDNKIKEEINNFIGIFIGIKKDSEDKNMIKNVFRVYDPYWNDEEDKWEEAMGIGQLREFAIDQLYDKGEDFIEDEKGTELANKIETLLDKVDKNYKELTMDEIDAVFEAFHFEYEELTIY